VEEDSDLTLKEFQAWTVTKYSLEGAVFLYYKGKRLINMMATLDETLRPGENLVISTDRSVAIARGGVGIGAYSVGGDGAVATAEGGYGTGGSYKFGLLRGGRGIGGDGKGISGSGGEGYGGPATSQIGGVKSGRGTGGNFEPRNASSAR
jgi:hypothetical protein